MDIEDEIDRIVELFEGHSLILAFNNCMPNGFELRISADGTLTLQRPNENMIEVCNYNSCDTISLEA